MKSVEFFRVPRSVLDETESALRSGGMDGFEVFALWTGVISGDVFEVERAHVPRQSSFKTSVGLMVRVEADELHALNVWMHEHGQTLGVQIHAHPTEAFHSDTDDTFPIVSQEGSLSVVAADFCSRGILDPTSAAFRLRRHEWEAVEVQRVVVLAD